MGKTIGAAALVLAAAAASPPAQAAAWEVVRGDEAARLSIDPKSVRRRGDEARFTYLVDFRRPQGDVKTAIYRSLVVKAAIRCKPRTIALYESEGYSGNAAKGVMVGISKASDQESRFQKIEAGTSDEDLWRRLCEKPAAKKQ